MAYRLTVSVPQVVSPFMPAAVLSWVSMMAAGMAAASVLMPNTDVLGEYAIAYLVAMPIPFGVAIAAVFLPVGVAALAVSKEKSATLATSGACFLAAPLAGLFLLAVGSAFWGPPARLGSGSSVPVLVALLVGGLTFGMAFARFRRLTRSAGLPQRAEGCR